MIECHPSIVFTWEAKFWSHVSSFDPIQVSVSIQVSDLGYKHSNSIIIYFPIFLRDYYLGDDYGMISDSSKLTWPPLGRINWWRVQYELFFGLVISGCSFNTLNVRAVAKLGLGIAAKNI